MQWNGRSFGCLADEDLTLQLLGTTGELRCFRWGAPDPDFNALASVMVLKLQNVLSAGWRKFQSFKIINIPATCFPEISFKHKETHTSLKFKMNVAAPLTSRFAGHLPSFPPTETLDLRRQSCWDEIEGSVRATSQGGCVMRSAWADLGTRSDGLRCKMGHLPGRIWLKTSYKWLNKWVTGVISPLWVEL